MVVDGREVTIEKDAYGRIYPSFLSEFEHLLHVLLVDEGIATHGDIMTSLWRSAIGIKLGIIST